MNVSGGKGPSGVSGYADKEDEKTYSERVTLHPVHRQSGVGDAKSGEHARWRVASGDRY